MLGTTYDGRDVAARLSVSSMPGCWSNVVELELCDDHLLGMEPVFGGVTKVVSRFNNDRPGIWLVRPKSFEPPPRAGLRPKCST